MHQHDITFWLLIACGISFLQMMYAYFKGLHLKRSGIRVVAKVLDRWMEDDSTPDPDDVSGSTTYYVKAYFDNEAGFQQTVTVTTSYKKWKSSDDEIPLIYPPNEAKRARVDTNASIFKNVAYGAVMFVAFWVILVLKMIFPPS